MSRKSPRRLISKSILFESPVCWPILVEDPSSLAASSIAITSVLREPRDRQRSTPKDPDEVLERDRIATFSSSATGSVLADNRKCRPTSRLEISSLSLDGVDGCARLMIISPLPMHTASPESAPFASVFLFFSGGALSWSSGGNRRRYSRRSEGKASANKISICHGI